MFPFKDTEDPTDCWLGRIVFWFYFEMFPVITFSKWDIRHAYLPTQVLAQSI